MAMVTSSIRPTLELFERQLWGNFQEMGWSAYRLSRACQCHRQLNWTTMNTVFISTEQQRIRIATALNKNTDFIWSEQQRTRISSDLNNNEHGFYLTWTTTTMDFKDPAPHYLRPLPHVQHKAKLSSLQPCTQPLRPLPPCPAQSETVKPSNSCPARLVLDSSPAVLQ